MVIKHSNSVHSGNSRAQAKNNQPENNIDYKHSRASKPSNLLYNSIGGGGGGEEATRSVTEKRCSHNLQSGQSAG